MSLSPVADWLLNTPWFHVIPRVNYFFQLVSRYLIWTLLSNEQPVVEVFHGQSLPVVAEYWGELVTEEEADRRGGKYLYELEDKISIDGKSRKNIARYINHSCSPNCEPQENVKESRLFIVAKRDIQPGEEFSYSYGKEYWEDQIKPLGCRCGCGGKGPKRWR